MNAQTWNTRSEHVEIELAIMNTTSFGVKLRTVSFRWHTAFQMQIPVILTPISRVASKMISRYSLNFYIVPNVPTMQANHGDISLLETGFRAFPIFWCNESIWLNQLPKFVQNFLLRTCIKFFYVCCKKFSLRIRSNKNRTHRNGATTLCWVGYNFFSTNLCHHIAYILKWHFMYDDLIQKWQNNMALVVCYFPEIILFFEYEIWSYNTLHCIINGKFAVQCAHNTHFWWLFVHKQR